MSENTVDFSYQRGQCWLLPTQPGPLVPRFPHTQLLFILFTIASRRGWYLLRRDFIPPQEVKISVRRHIFSTDPLYILRSYKHAIESISNRASQRGGERCFLITVKCRNKIHAYPIINKSTERHPRLPY